MFEQIWNFFSDSSVIPFSVAFALMFGIFIFEMVLLTIGGFNLESIFPDMDVDFEPDVSAGFSDALASLTLFGKIPFIIMIALLTGGFGMSGLVLQNLAQAMLGTTLPLWLAIIIAVPCALLFTRATGGLIAKIIPKEVSFAVSRQDFIGQVAIINIGTATLELPAEAKLKDAYGNLHYVRVRPETEDESYPPGTEILLLKEEPNGVFTAMKA